MEEPRCGMKSAPSPTVQNQSKPNGVKAAIMELTQWGEQRGASEMTGNCTRLALLLLVVRQPSTAGSYWPILLEKSALVSMAEKYASEIEILTFG